ncbi:MAG: WD40/YVTN/BNR-like repeat-containing protein [Nevskiaceae bacterium]
MARSVHSLGFLGATAFLVVAVFSAAAQDEAPLVVKPRPAERMSLAAKSLLLDVVRAGDGFVAVGDRGSILLSADGKQWEQADVPVRAALTAVTFVDAQRGWAVGHDAAIVATGDGGKTWSLQNFQPELEKPLLDVLFLDASRGIAVGAYGLLLTTADGGKTWKEQDSPIREEEVHFNALTRLANGSLFIAGESGMLAISSDQGRSWSKLRSPYDGTFFGVLPAGPNGVLVFGMRGNAYLSPNARGGWTKLQTHSVASMFGGTALPGGELAMVGLNGVIFIADGSGKVRSLQTPSGTPLSAAIPLDGGLLAVGESGVQLLASLQ